MVHAGLSPPERSRGVFRQLAHVREGVRLATGSNMSRAISPHTVLIVDDDTESRISLASILTTHGYRTITAPDALEGLAAAREHRPSVILLDTQMPVVNWGGFMAVQVRDERIRGIPISSFVIKTRISVRPLSAARRPASVGHSTFGTC